jgi:chromosome segregation ATPase
LDERLDSLENLIGTAARFAERASEKGDDVDRELTHLSQDVQRNGQRLDRIEARLDDLEANQQSLIAGQDRLEQLVMQVLSRLTDEGGNSGDN